MSILFKIVLTAFLITTPPFLIFGFLYESGLIDWAEKLTAVLAVIWSCLLVLVIIGLFCFVIQWIWT